MARASDLSPAQIGWTSEWYLRHETLEQATAAIVDYQSTIALAQRFGSGEHSSSDGKRGSSAPTASRPGRCRYFGRDQRAAGRLPDDLDVGGLSPAIHAHLNINVRHIHPDRPPRHHTQPAVSTSGLAIYH